MLFLLLDVHLHKNPFTSLGTFRAICWIKGGRSLPSNKLGGDLEALALITLSVKRHSSQSKQKNSKPFDNTEGVYQF